MIRGESLDLAGCAIDPDLRAHLDRMAFDAALKLLITIMRQPDRPGGEKHRRQCDVKHEWRMVASAETAAYIGELRVDAGGLERRTSFSQQERNRLRGLVGRLNAEHELKFIALPVVPAETTFRLKKHRVNGLGLEGAVEHQQCRFFAASSARIC